MFDKLLTKGLGDYWIYDIIAFFLTIKYYLYYQLCVHLSLAILKLIAMKRVDRRNQDKAVCKENRNILATQKFYL